MCCSNRLNSPPIADIGSYKRTLEGPEIDEIIQDLETREALAGGATAPGRLAASANWRRAAFARDVITSMALLPHPALVKYRNYRRL